MAQKNEEIKKIQTDDGRNVLRRRPLKFCNMAESLLATLVQ